MYTVHFDLNDSLPREINTNSDKSCQEGYIWVQRARKPNNGGELSDMNCTQVAWNILSYVTCVSCNELLCVALSFLELRWDA